MPQTGQLTLLPRVLAMWISNRFSLTLRDKGYKEAGRTSIQTLKLSEFHYESNNEIEIFTEFSEEWFKDYCIVGNKSIADIKVFQNAWKSLIPSHCFISYKLDNKRVAFAMGVIQEGYIGVFGVLVKEEYRRKGYGKFITCEFLNFGKIKGCENSYLQVEVDNINANELYKKIGLIEIYQYWYLLKEIDKD